MNKETTVVKNSNNSPVVAETPKVARVTKKVTPATLKRISVIGKKAHEEVNKLSIVKALEADANAGIAYVKGLVPAKQEGKFSRLGHLIKSQCGQLDEAILNCEAADFGDWIKYVAKANCETRKSDADDNAAIAKRLHSHLRTLSGAKRNTLKKRLGNVQLADKVEEIHNAFVAAELLYREHLGVAKF